MTTNSNTEVDEWVDAIISLGSREEEKKKPQQHYDDTISLLSGTPHDWMRRLKRFQERQQQLSSSEEQSSSNDGADALTVSLDQLETLLVSTAPACRNAVEDYSRQCHSQEERVQFWKSKQQLDEHEEQQQQHHHQQTTTSEESPSSSFPALVSILNTVLADNGGGGGGGGGDCHEKNVDDDDLFKHSTNRPCRFTEVLQVKLLEKSSSSSPEEEEEEEEEEEDGNTLLQRMLDFYHAHTVTAENNIGRSLAALHKLADTNTRDQIEGVNTAPDTEVTEGTAVVSSLYYDFVHLQAFLNETMLQRQLMESNSKDAITSSSSSLLYFNNNTNNNPSSPSISNQTLSFWIKSLDQVDQEWKQQLMNNSLQQQPHFRGVRFPLACSTEWARLIVELSSANSTRAFLETAIRQARAAARKQQDALQQRLQVETLRLQSQQERLEQAKTELAKVVGDVDSLQTKLEEALTATFQLSTRTTSDDDDGETGGGNNKDKITIRILLL